MFMPARTKRATSMTDLWVFENCPANIGGTRDDGNLPFNFEPPKPAAIVACPIRRQAGRL